MNKRDAQKIQIGDHVACKHNLGEGKVVDYVEQPRLGLEGRYPMIRFHDQVTHTDTWCTYRVINAHIPLLRSVT